MAHSEYMKLALNLAKKGRGYTSPNPMVGAVIVKNGDIVGIGYHKKFGGDHAEIIAIKQAGEDSKGATLYVTLEPCNHKGKTPPCTVKIVNAGIKHVVFSMLDPNPNVSGGGEIFLKKNGIKVTSGVCKKEAYILNECFIKYVKTGLPFVIIKCAATLDGQIGTSIGNSKWITGYKARQYVHKLRHCVDAIIVGSNTVREDNPSLNTRLTGMIGMNPARVIFSTKLSISLKSKIFTKNFGSGTYIITGKNVNKVKKIYLEDMGVKLFCLNNKDNLLDMKKTMKILGNIGFSSVLIEGGGKLIRSALSLGIADKIYFFYAPKILGGNDGIPICSGSGVKIMKNCIKVHNMTVFKLGNDMVLRGYIRSKVS